MAIHPPEMKVLVLYPERAHEENGEKNRHIAIEERPVPTPEKGEVLVKIYASSIGGRDKRLFHAEELSWRMRALRKKRGVITGVECSGVVVTDGETFREGDEVYGYIHFSSGGVTHAEYACIPESMLSFKPSALNHIQTTTAPVACMTSFRALHDLAHLEHGQRLLLSGATGGVGAYAIQIAKMMGAHITAQGRKWQQDEMARLGVDRFIEYTQEEILHSEDVFDVVFDIAALWNFELMRPHLAPKGVYVTTHPEKDMFGIVSSYFTSKKSKYLFVSHGEQRALATIGKLFDEEKLEPIVGSASPLEEAYEEFSENRKALLGRRVLTL